MVRAATFSIFLFLQLSQSNPEQIIWQEGYRLSWKNFEGTPIPHTNFVASTNTGINFGYSYTMTNKQVEVEYSISSFFNPKKSWYLPGEVSQHILNHEQTHFDISELHARILRKRMASRKFSKNVKAEIETIYLQVEEQRKAMQRKFDVETDHSRNIKKEIFWEEYVARQLAKYDAWK